MPFIISHTAISWCSTCSTMVVLNAYDITLVSLSGTYSSSFYLRKLCLELGFIQTSPTILCEDSIASTSSTLKSDSLRRGLPLNLGTIKVLLHSQRSIDFEINPKHIPICWTYVTAHHSTHATFYAWFPSAIVSS